MQKPGELITTEEFKMLVKKDGGYDLPSSIIKWNKKILQGQDPRPLIKRLRPIVGLFAHPELR